MNFTINSRRSSGTYIYNEKCYASFEAAVKGAMKEEAQRIFLEEVQNVLKNGISAFNWVNLMRKLQELNNQHFLVVFVP